MAAGWNAKVVVETWSQGGPIATSMGLAIATRHTGGRHICVVPDEESKFKYVEAITARNDQTAPEVIVGEAEEGMAGLEGIDFLVVDCRVNEFSSIIRVAKLGHRGAVLVCKNASSRGGSTFRWQSVLDGKTRIVRSVFLPVGKGVDIAHVGATDGRRGKSGSRWIKGVDQQSGEEFVIRK